MKYTLLSLALAAVVGAQSNSTLIPANISSSCSDFLTKLNSDTTLSSCVQPLINATASFSPTSGANLTENDIAQTLATLCETTSGCSDSTIRTWLSGFYSSCSAELTSPSTYNSQVRELYDIVYVFQPLKGAVCSIDSSNQEYCVNEIINETKTSSNSSSVSANATASGIANSTTLVTVLNTSFSPIQFAADNLYIIISVASQTAKRAFELFSARDTQSVNMATVITPNTTTYRSTNLPFLFLQPTMPASSLCTPCTREVMVAYVKWETGFPYALGLSASPILGGQSALWNGISSTCGPSFINAINAEVGQFATSSNGNSTVSSAESRWNAPGGSAAVTAVVGVAMVAGAMVFLA